MQLIQIVPRLPPAVDGVGDYAWLLAKQLRVAHGIQTQFIVCDPEWKPEAGSQRAEDRGQKSEVGTQSSTHGAEQSEIGNRKSEIILDGFPVRQLRERSAEELLRVLTQSGMPATVLLQYVGYGYQKRGCPVWLTRALRAWKSQRSEIGSQMPGLSKDFQPRTSRCLLTMFHELYAKGPPWRSEFWVSAVQKWVVKQLARLSDHGATNLNICAGTLQQFTRRGKSVFTVLPVFSNVGEPESLPDWSERSPRMVVFGSASWRRQIYSQHKHELEAACQSLGLAEIVDIGVPVEIPHLSVHVLKRGILTAAEASREMLAARAGFFSYPVNCLGKSGIFAAYAAHGLVPVTLANNQTPNQDGLERGKHFLVAGGLMNDAAQVSETVHEWYQRHTLSVHARQFSSMFGDGFKN